MADVSDVYNAFLTQLQTILYPAGPPAPNDVSPLTGQVVRFYPGWPQAAALDNDIAAGISNVTVFAPKDTFRNTTRYELNWIQTSTPVIWLSAVVDNPGTHVTLSGAFPVPFILQNIGILCNGVGVAYQVLATDTLTTVAANLATLVSATITPATSSGPVISIPGAKNLTVRIGGTGTAMLEVMRQEQYFHVTFWAPDNTTRYTLSTPFKLAIAKQEFLTLADGSGARVITRGDWSDDEPQKQTVYKRDLRYYVEYGTFDLQTQTQIIIQKTVLSGGTDPNAPLIGTYFS